MRHSVRVKPTRNRRVFSVAFPTLFKESNTGKEEVLVFETLNYQPSSLSYHHPPRQPPLWSRLGDLRTTLMRRS